MSSTQQTLLRQANDLNSKLAATVLWKYVCPNTDKTFYLQEKVVTIRSPFTGKTFTTKPERESLGDVGKALREESKAKTAATVLWKYLCPDTSKTFYLQEKVVTIKSPFTGKTFTTKPERESLGDVGKALREESKAKTAASGQTLARRINDLYSEYMDDVKDALVSFEPEAARSVKMAWSPSTRGFDQLDVIMKAADGSMKKFKLLPSEPRVDAGDILYQNGGY
jgi:hypothetical protein